VEVGEPAPEAQYERTEEREDRTGGGEGGEDDRFEPGPNGSIEGYRARCQDLPSVATAGA
jgi:hypothetical protein